MERKIIVSITLATLSTSTFALDIHKGKLISHKEWTTDNTPAIYKSYPAKAKEMFAHIKQKNLTSNDKEDVIIYANTGTEALKTAVGSTIPVYANHYIYIRNNSNVKKSFSYMLETCASNSDKTQQCAYFSDVVELEADGYADGYLEPQLEMTFAQPGKFTVSALSMVMPYGIYTPEALTYHVQSTSSASIEVV